MNEFMQRPSRPTGPAPVSGSDSSGPKKKTTGLKFNRSQHIGVALMLLSGAIIAFALLALMLINNKTDVRRENDRIGEDTVQAVFLNDPNGQVYFGNLEALDSNTYLLTDIYYVQVQTAIQPDTGEQTTSGVSLAKLGNELHGPNDAMYINRDQVLFWENLKASGQVMCAIVDYKTNELGVEGLTKDPECDERAATNAAAQQSAGQPPTESGTQATQPAGATAQ